MSLQVYSCLHEFGGEIERWRNHYNRRQTQPTPRQTERMRDAMERNGALLTRPQRTELEFIARLLRG
ncbi:MAG: hypothetical protein ABI876_00560 [Bacteroidota bacterium]